MRKLWLVILFVLGFLLGAGGAYALERGGTGSPATWAVPATNSLWAVETSALADITRLLGEGHPAAPVVKISPQATVEFQVDTPAKVQIADETAAKAGMTGLTLEEVRSLYPQWKVKRFTAGRVVLSERIQGAMFLGINDGFVTLFFGQPGHPQGIEQQTGVMVTKLRPEDQARLEQGIPVKNLEEALRYMEGLGD